MTRITNADLDELIAQSGDGLVARLARELRACRKEGWVLVPKEPTREMIEAGYRSMRLNSTMEQLAGHTAEKFIYEAMLAAAPEPQEDL